MQVILIYNKLALKSTLMLPHAGFQGQVATPSFYVGTRVQTQVLTLEQQALLATESAPSPELALMAPGL